MDFQANTQLLTQKTLTDSPFLQLDTRNQDEQERRYVGDSNWLWHPYEKYVLFVANPSRLTPAEGAPLQLPAAMLDCPGMGNNNNNFDGVLDADSCSLNSFTNEDSSDMDTFSDVDLTDNSEDETYETGSVSAQGCGFEGSFASTTTFLPTTTTTFGIDDEQAAQQLIGRDDITINSITDDRVRQRSRGRGDFAEEEPSFKSLKQEKAKPGLPEVALLQGSGSSSFSSPVVEHLVHVEDHEDDDCMCAAAAYGMYYAEDMQMQNSF